MKNKDKIFSQGFLTLEILLSLAIGAAAVTAGLAVVFDNQSVIIDVQNEQAALAENQQLAEEAENLPFNAQSTTTLQSMSLSSGRLVKPIADYAKLANIETSWSNGGLKKFAGAFALVTDWRNGFGRDTCSLAFSNDWSKPVLTGSLDLGANNPATSVDVNFNKAYITADSADVSKEDFFIVDTSNISSPRKISGISTGPGLEDVAIVGDYAFAANSTISSQLQLIKISDPLHPVLVAQFKLNFNNNSHAKSIYYKNKNIFIGTEKSTGPEFYIYNVDNPLRPTILGAYETDSVVNDIYVNGSVAYLTLGQGKQLLILDISNPANIKELGSFSPPGADVQSGQALAVLDDNLIFGRAGGLPNTGYKEFYWLDAKNISSPSIKGELDTNASIRSLFLRDGLVFTAAAQTGSEFKVYSLSDGLPSVSSLVLSGNPAGLDCEGQNIFIASEAQPQLQIISP